MAKRVVLIEGEPADTNTLSKVKAEIPTGGSVMVVLDSGHSHEHVLAELRSYGPIATMACYLVVADIILGHLNASPSPSQSLDCISRTATNPSALEIYFKETSRFKTDPVLNGKLILSSSPGGYLRA